jgi:hypothetical protein
MCGTVTKPTSVGFSVGDSHVTSERWAGRRTFHIRSRLTLGGTFHINMLTLLEEVRVELT